MAGILEPFSFGLHCLQIRQGPSILYRVGNRCSSGGDENVWRSFFVFRCSPRVIRRLTAPAIIALNYIGR